MKALYNFSAHHPLIGLVLFDIIGSALSIGAGYLIHFKTGWDLSTVIFLEALLFLLLAYSCINGNAGLKAENFIKYREFKHDDSSQLAHLFSVKYGMIGVILFFSTWIIR